MIRMVIAFKIITRRQASVMEGRDVRVVIGVRKTGVMVGRNVRAMTIFR